MFEFCTYNIGRLYVNNSDELLVKQTCSFFLECFGINELVEKEWNFSRKFSTNGSCSFVYFGRGKGSFESKVCVFLFFLVSVSVFESMDR